MIEELGLPDSAGDLQLTSDSFARPLLPRLHEFWQGLGVEFGRTEEVYMVGHDDVATNGPAVALSRGTPFVKQNCGRFSRRQNRAALESAGGDEIDRMFDPNPMQPAEVAVYVWL
jgi:hypothetical protein